VSAPPHHRRARRALGVALTVVVALAGGIALLVFFTARDDAPVEQAQPPAPGQAFADLGARHLPPSQRGRARYNSQPPTSGPHVAEPVRRDGVVLTDDQILHALESGNVVLVYGTGRPPPEVRALAREAAGGPFDPALVEAGQAVLLARRPGTAGVVGLAWRHLLRARSASDPALRRFVEHWLGRGRD
jgi:hypothetical protein